jgi:hypothetical protein
VPLKIRRPLWATRSSALLGRGLLVAAALGVSAAAVPPELAYWRQNTSGAKGSGDPSIDSYVNTTDADIQEVWYTPHYVYVRATGVPSYGVGPFNSCTYPGDQHYVFRFPRFPTPETATNRDTPLSAIGFFLNGVPIYNAKDGHAWNEPVQDIWHYNAPVREADGFDAALGHPATSLGHAPPCNKPTDPAPGRYHHHQLPPSLQVQLDQAVGVTSSATHSRIIGYALDGFPVYGPFGYANTDGTGGIVRMTSSWRLRGDLHPGDHRDHLFGQPQLASADWGPDVDDVGGAYPLGAFIEDYQYVSGLGILDKYNGRSTVTPEYPGGTYAYFATVDDTGANAFPYTIGFQYYGQVKATEFELDGLIRVDWAVPGPPACVRQSPWGDADGDFDVDRADVIYNIRAASGVLGYPSTETGDVAPYPSADARGFGDGATDTLDWVRLLRHVIGLDNDWPWA